MKTALVVDDVEIVCLTMKRLLEGLGLKVKTAKTGVDAIELANKEKFDLITMDIQLPDMSGVKALKMIRSIYPEVKVMMVTGGAEKEILLECLTSGACDYILKPIDIDRVEASVRKHLKL